MGKAIKKMLAVAGTAACITAFSTESIAASTQMYAIDDTLLYSESNYTDNNKGRILRGSALQIDEPGEGSFVSVTYAGENGYVPIDMLTDDELLVKPSPDGAHRTFTYEMLYPSSRFVEKMDEAANLTMSKFAESGFEDRTYMSVMDSKSINIYPFLMKQVYSMGFQYLALEYAPEESIEPTLWLYVPVVECEDEHLVYNLSFDYDGKTFRFDDPGSVAKLRKPIKIGFRDQSSASSTAKIGDENTRAERDDYAMQYTYLIEDPSKELSLTGNEQTIVSEEMDETVEPAENKEKTAEEKIESENKTQEKGAWDMKRIGTCIAIVAIVVIGVVGIIMAIRVRKRAI